MNSEKALNRMRALLRTAMIMAKDYGLEVNLEAWTKENEKDRYSGFIRIGNYELWMDEKNGSSLNYQPIRKEGEPSRVSEWRRDLEPKQFKNFLEPPKEDAPQTDKSTAGHKAQS